MVHGASEDNLSFGDFSFPVSTSKSYCSPWSSFIK